MRTGECYQILLSPGNSVWNNFQERTVGGHNGQLGDKKDSWIYKMTVRDKRTAGDTK